MDVVSLEDPAVSEAKEDPEMKNPYYSFCRGYKHHTWLTVLKWLLVVGTGGVFGLFLLWSFRVRNLFRIPTDTESNAAMFVIKPHKEFGGVREEVDVRHFGSLKYFTFQCTSFFFDPKTGAYSPHPDVSSTWTHKEISRMRAGLDSSVLDDTELRFRFGENVIHVELDPWWWDCTFRFQS
jgi:hypothetical protein